MANARSSSWGRMAATPTKSASFQEVLTTPAGDLNEQLRVQDSELRNSLSAELVFLNGQF
jgi:hypothetical protein